MKMIGHLLRAALIGFLALFTVGGMMVATDIDGKRRAVQAAAESGDDVPSEVEISEAGRRGGAGMFMVGVLGAMVAVATSLLLLLFPVGPASKILFGVICGPALPMLMWAPTKLRQGDTGDLGGIIVLGMLVGLLAGILEANRVARIRRETAGGAA